MQSKKLLMPAGYAQLSEEEMMYLDGGITIDKDNFWPALLNGFSVTCTISWKGTSVDDAFGFSKTNNETWNKIMTAVFKTINLTWTFTLK
jgi:hypothetical protein